MLLTDITNKFVRHAPDINETKYPGINETQQRELE